MNNNSSNSFNACVTLSKTGDEKSLRTLIKYSLGNNSAYRKNAILALRKTHNQKLLTTLLNEKINNANSPEEKNRIISIAFKLQRKKYLYRYLQHLAELEIDLFSTDFFNSINRRSLAENEQLDLLRP